MGGFVFSVSPPLADVAERRECDGDVASHTSGFGLIERCEYIIGWQTDGPRLHGSVNSDVAVDVNIVVAQLLVPDHIDTVYHGATCKSIGDVLGRLFTIHDFTVFEIVFLVVGMMFTLYPLLLHGQMHDDAVTLTPFLIDNIVLPSRNVALWFSVDGDGGVVAPCGHAYEELVALHAVYVNNDTVADWIVARDVEVNSFTTVVGW